MALDLFNGDVSVFVLVDEIEGEAQVLLSCSQLDIIGCDNEF
jgi:hypothetical protein